MKRCSKENQEQIVDDYFSDIEKNEWEILKKNGIPQEH